MRTRRRLVTFACGHSKYLSFSSGSPQEAVDTTLGILHHSFCAACHRLQREAFAQRVRDAFGLSPIVGTQPEQVGLAEVIRIHLLEALIPPPGSASSPEGLTELLDVLNRCLQAEFWIEHRMILTSWNRQQISNVLLAVEREVEQSAHHRLALEASE